MSAPSRGHAVVVGSGAGGSVAAHTLVNAGWDVTILEKGRNYFTALGDPGGPALPPFGNDEVRYGRDFIGDNDFEEPRSGRTQADAAAGIERRVVGDLNALPATVGGGTIHWDAKVPRFWRMDFERLSSWGPVEGADLVDWPFTYDDLAAYYDRNEDVIGVQGSLADTPRFVLDQSPHAHDYPMPPGPAEYGALLFKAGGAKLGWRVHPFPMAANSVPRDGRGVCVNCGFCSGFGCPNNSRGGAAVTWLHRAMLAGATLETRKVVRRVLTGPDGNGARRAVGVEYQDGLDRTPRVLDADVVVLAASCIESTRLALLSGIGATSGRLGRYLCFHTETGVGSIFPQRLHAHRGRSASHCMLEAAVPDVAAGKQYGLPWIRGGIVEVGGGSGLIEEAGNYSLLPFLRGKAHKNLMRQSPLRDHLLGVTMLGEDLPQWGNTVDIDPAVKDIWGLPVARITYSPHRHDTVASWTWGARLMEAMYAGGATQGFYLPSGIPLLSDQQIGDATAHIMGSMRMGSDPAMSVTDEFGRVHDCPNVVVCDGAVFASAGAMNPTNTIMAVGLRSATALAYGEAQARQGPVLVG